jgi:S1-C subfamily serine protease
MPRVLDYPRYLIAAEVASGRLVLRPLFVSGLLAVSSPLWGGELWRLPEGLSVKPGTFLFTTQGALAGLAVAESDGIALVPAALLSQSAKRLLQQRQREPGHLGISVERLTPSLRAATGATHGVIVTSVDGAGPSANVIRPTDIIADVNDQPVDTLEHWRAIVERLAPGEAVHFGISRAGAFENVVVTAVGDADAQPAVAGRPAALGARFRTVPNRGAEVISVEAHSVAAQAGIRTGDLITTFGPVDRPTPAQLLDAFRSLEEGRAVLVAVSRGDEHQVLALTK